MKLKTLDEFIAVDLRDDLRNPDFALGYLQACFEEVKTSGNPAVFFAAVQDVARANEIAEDEVKSDVNRSRILRPKVIARATQKTAN